MNNIFNLNNSIGTQIIDWRRERGGEGTTNESGRIFLNINSYSPKCKRDKIKLN